MWTSNWNDLNIMKWSDKFSRYESSLSSMSMCFGMFSDTTTHFHVLENESCHFIPFIAFLRIYRNRQFCWYKDKINIGKIWFVMYWLVIDKLWCRIYRRRFLLSRHCHKERVYHAKFCRQTRGRAPLCVRISRIHTNLVVARHNRHRSRRAVTKRRKKFCVLPLTLRKGIYDYHKGRSPKCSKVLEQTYLSIIVIRKSHVQ